MRKFLFSLVFVFLFYPLSLVFAENTLSGICVEDSRIYGKSFFDVSAGSLYLDDTQYFIPETYGLLSNANSYTNVYAYKPRNKNTAEIGVVKDGDGEDYFRQNGVLIGRVYANVLDNSLTITKIENFMSSCPNYGTIAKETSYIGSDIFINQTASVIGAIGASGSSNDESIVVVAAQPEGFPTLAGPLLFGSTSDKVRLLQQMLASDPSIYPEGLATGYYGDLTRKAVERFQTKYGIVSSGTVATTGFGSAGPTTRAKLNEIYGQKTN